MNATINYDGRIKYLYILLKMLFVGAGVMCGVACICVWVGGWVGACVRACVMVCVCLFVSVWCARVFVGITTTTTTMNL